MKLFFGLCLGGLFGMSMAHADSVIATLKAESPYTASYWGMVTGPTVGNLKFIETDPATGKLDPTSPDNLYSQLKLDYKLDSRWSVGVIVNWLFQTDQVQPFVMRESGFRIANKSIAKFGIFNWSGDLRFLLPTSLRAHHGGITTLVETLQSISADAGKWSVGFVQFHILRTFEETGGGKRFDLYFSPYANYNFNEITAATFAVESYPQYFTGASDVQGWSPAPYDVSVGAAFNITPDVNLNPVLLLYPDRLNWNTTTFAAYLSAKLI